MGDGNERVIGLATPARLLEGEPLRPPFEIDVAKFVVSTMRAQNYAGLQRTEGERALYEKAIKVLGKYLHDEA